MLVVCSAEMSKTKYYETCSALSLVFTHQRPRYKPRNIWLCDVNCLSESFVLTSEWVDCLIWAAGASSGPKKVTWKYPASELGHKLCLSLNKEGKKLDFQTFPVSESPLHKGKKKVWRVWNYKLKHTVSGFQHSKTITIHDTYREWCNLDG